MRHASGGEAFLHAAGWRVLTEDLVKFFVFQAQPASFGWRVLEMGIKELEKVRSLLEGKLKVSGCSSLCMSGYFMHLQVIITNFCDSISTPVPGIFIGHKNKYNLNHSPPPCPAQICIHMHAALCTSAG